MSSELYRRAGELASSRQPFALATVVRVEGSSSAKRGSKALINEHGKIILGWVGGGCAESAVRSEAVKAIQSEKPSLITLDMQDEVLGVGMPCGGMMDVYIEPVVPQPQLVIAGHGRIAETLASLGHLLNFSVTVHDPSAERDKFPHADALINKDFDVKEVSFGLRTYVVIATLHKNDHLWLQRALQGEAAYVALIASAHRSRLVLDYLLEEGIPQEVVDRVWAPAGLDLGAANPEEIALSIISQIVALRRGGTVLSLKQKNEAAADVHDQVRSGEEASSATTATDKVIRHCET
jgi:xanthine dehydrogenase accessory factor